MQEGIADVEIMSLILNLHWHKSVHVSPVIADREIYLVRAIPEKKSRYQTLIEPFNWQVWIFVVFSICVMCLLIIFIEKSGFTNIDTRKLDLFSSCTLAFGVMICEGLPHHLIRNIERSKLVVLAFWIPTACLIGMAYQSNLLASLVKVENQKAINSFQDILDNKITVNIANGTLTAHLMKTSSNNIVRQVFEQYVVPVDLDIKRYFLRLYLPVSHKLDNHY